jgi:hypothetical protein
MTPVEFTFWQTAYKTLLTESSIAEADSMPFRSHVRLMEMASNVAIVRRFRCHTYFEYLAKRRSQNITIRVAFAFRGSLLFITSIEVYGEHKPGDPRRSLLLLRSTISHADQSECDIGVKADMNNATFVKCCSGLDASVSFAHPLSLYEEQYVQANWLQAIHARNKLEAVEMARDEEYEGSEGDNSAE